MYNVVFRSKVNSVIYVDSDVAGNVDIGDFV
jgi:hypothetical protein